MFLGFGLTLYRYLMPDSGPNPSAERKPSNLSCLGHQQLVTWTVDHTRPIFRDIIDPNNNLHRQRLIRKIQNLLKGKLLVYSANPSSPVPQATAIIQQD